MKVVGKCLTAALMAARLDSLALNGLNNTLLNDVLLCPPRLKCSGGHIAFGVDPVGICIASWLHSIS